MPNEVLGSALLDDIIHVFVMACRERRYAEGTPLPLSVSDVSHVLAVYHVNMARWLIDDIVFALDEIVRG
ncbi:hypothetical protein LU293_04205 [Moraxella nasovis]|uniref:hypothetical protein n=1 Tax=Moraxella nasovis TaxID=2904121 RepID=UPI001F6215B9|nr:hypothetical protein [Moraxella nasovis]UNU73280.1 hypothetical protein LU293_09480 [Moraxella nasovis]UNU74105.1 hypothetical protein LU293_04205 [Moraxella nasovis]